MSSEKTWEQRCADLIERIMATSVVNGDARPLQEELKSLLAERPEHKRKKKHGTTG